MSFRVVYRLPMSLTFYIRQAVRIEVGASGMDGWNVAQVALKLRALQQSDGRYVLRELLRSVCVLDEGIGIASRESHEDLLRKVRGVSRELLILFPDTARLGSDGLCISHTPVVE